MSEARHGFAESLRIREELGYLVGTAPALVSLADTESEPEASRLRQEARRLFRLLGGVPTWLARQLTPPAPDAEPPACREKLSSFAHIVRRAMSRSLSRRAGRRVCRRRVSNGGSGARPGTREERDARRRPWPLRW